MGYGHGTPIDNFDFAYELVKTKAESSSYYYEDEEVNNIYKLKQESIHPCYTLENKVLIVVPGGNEGRYFERLKKNGEFNIDDALVFE